MENNNSSQTLVIHTFAEEKTEVRYGRWNKKISIKTGTWLMTGYTEKGEKIFEAENQDLTWQIEADALAVYLAIENIFQNLSNKTVKKIIVKTTNYPLSRLKVSKTKAGYYLEKTKQLLKEKEIEFVLLKISNYNNIAALNTEKQKYFI